MASLKNKRWEIFAQQVAKGSTAGDAYAKAGYKPNPKNADRLKKTEVVSLRIEELSSIGAQKAGVTIERIMAELARIGFSDITKAVQWGEALAIRPLSSEGEELDPIIVQGVALVPSADLSPDVAAAISEVRKTKEGISIKFHDKVAALLNMGKHLGMFKDKLELSGDIQHAVTIEYVTAPTVKPKQSG